MRRGSAVIACGCALFAAYIAYSLLWYEPVQIVESGLVRTAGGVAVTGKVKNRATARADQVSIEVRFFDAHGHQAAADSVSLGNLEAGASRDFASSSGPADATSYTISIDRGKNPYGN